MEQYRQRCYQIVFESDTPAGKAFDVALLMLILVSIVLLIVGTVDRYEERYADVFHWCEIVVTAFFTMEYVLRLWCAKHRWGYVVSFFGIVDLLAILPVYLALFMAGIQYLLVIRIFRLLRVFRILKMVRYLGEAAMLVSALKASGRKIAVFLFVVINIITFVGTLMYIIEGPAHGFSSIPISMYWTVVTLTTVGYGDIAPATPLGQMLASLLMVTGYAIIAVPTGIVSVELSNVHQQSTKPPQPNIAQNDKLPTCPHCHKTL